MKPVTDGVEVVTRVIKLARYREVVFDEWVEAMHERNHEQCNKLYQAMLKIHAEIASLIGYEPIGSEYLYLSHGTFLDTRFQPDPAHVEQALRDIASRQSLL